MTEPTIFITYHKPYELFNLPNNYKKIQAGTNCKKYRISTNHEIIKQNSYNDFFKQMDYYDNIGDNISDYNNYISELSVFYWVWKNLKFNNNDYIGFCSYRRIIYYPPNYKNYDLIYSVFGHNQEYKHMSRLDWIHNLIQTQTLNYLLNLLKDNFSEIYNNFIYYINNSMLKDEMSFEIFVMKYSIFKEYMKILEPILIKIISSDMIKLPNIAHACELISTFIIYELSKNYKTYKVDKLIFNNSI